MCLRERPWSCGPGVSRHAEADREAALGGEQHAARACRSIHLPSELFAAALAVDVGGVDEVHSALDRPIEDPPASSSGR